MCLWSLQIPARRDIGFDPEGVRFRIESSENATILASNATVAGAKGA